MPLWTTSSPENSQRPRREGHVQAPLLEVGHDIYIPYTVELEPGKLTGTPLVMYVVAIRKPAAGRRKRPRQLPRAVEGDAVGEAEHQAQRRAFEDVAFITPKPDGTIQRAIELMPAITRSTSRFPKNLPIQGQEGCSGEGRGVRAAPHRPGSAEWAFHEQRDLAKDIQPATVQLSGQQQLEEPYTVSGYKITPSPVSSFPKSGELLWVFYIYNEKEAASGKPDVAVDYNFFRAGEDKPFVNMPSAAYNAGNLPPEFNLSAGHMVFVAQAFHSRHSTRVNTRFR
jgi:hypothetical protein